MLLARLQLLPFALLLEKLGLPILLQFEPGLFQMILLKANAVFEQRSIFEELRLFQLELGPLIGPLRRERFPELVSLLLQLVRNPFLLGAMLLQQRVA